MPDELLLLRDLIQERTGLFFPDHRGIESMADRLRSRVEKSGCRSFAEYHRFLVKNENAGEWIDIITDLSRPVSSLFRHRFRTQILVNTVLPRLFSGKDINKLKIWSAGCAAGEEPVAIAIALSEAGWFDRVRIEVCASDASHTALGSARRGVYTDGRTGYLSAELKAKYFIPVDHGLQVRPELHKRITFKLANLVNETEIAALAASDVIFCRNVFIYFSEEAVFRTLDLFAKYMPAGGYLFTDEGDYFTSLVTKVGAFEQQMIDNVSIWKKRA